MGFCLGLMTGKTHREYRMEFQKLFRTGLEATVLNDVVAGFLPLGDQERWEVKSLMLLPLHAIGKHLFGPSVDLKQLEECCEMFDKLKTASTSAPDDSRS